MSMKLNNFFFSSPKTETSTSNFHYATRHFIKLYSYLLEITQTLKET